MTLRGLLAWLMLAASIAAHADELADVRRLAAAGELERALGVARAAPAPPAPALRFA